VTRDFLSPKYLADVTKELKEAVRQRLPLSPCAYGLLWLARNGGSLTHSAHRVMEVILTWTYARGNKWAPAGTIANDQIRAALGWAEGPESGYALRRLTDELVTKGFSHRVLGQQGRGHSTWYCPTLTDQVLQLPNLYPSVPTTNDLDPEADRDREHANRGLATLLRIDHAEADRLEKAVAAKTVLVGRSKPVVDFEHGTITLHLPGIAAYEP
jgi:hypothetical protein